MPRHTVSEQAERTLEHWLDQLMKGQIQLQDLPLCISAWFHAGEFYGRVSRQHEIDQLNHQCDVLYMQAFTPKERREEYQRQLDEYFRLKDDEFFNSLDVEQKHDPQSRRSPDRSAQDPREIHRTNHAA